MLLVPRTRAASHRACPDLVTAGRWGCRWSLEAEVMRCDAMIGAAGRRSQVRCACVTILALAFAAAVKGGAPWSAVTGAAQVLFLGVEGHFGCGG
jgi:hypothetical protein